MVVDGRLQRVYYARYASLWYNPTGWLWLHTLHPVDVVVLSLPFASSSPFMICLMAASSLGVGVTGVVLPLVG